MKRYGTVAAVALLVLGSFAVAETISVGQTLRVGFGMAKKSANGECNCARYEVALEAGHRYAIYTSDIDPQGTSRDTVLHLYNAKGTLLRENDDASRPVVKGDEEKIKKEGGLTSSISFAPASTASYFVQVRAYEEGTTGTCSLTVRDLGLTPTFDLLSIRVGETLRNQTFQWDSLVGDRSEGGYGLYETTLMPGVSYEMFTSEIAESGESTDTVLYLLDVDRGVVAENDDSDGFASRITYTVPTTATSSTFRIALRSFTEDATGTCSLTLRELRLQAADDIQDLPVGESLGNQGYEWREAFENREAGDYGRYRSELKARSKYTYTVSATYTDLEGVAIYVTDPDGLPVAAASDERTALEQKLEFRAAKDGEYILKIRGFIRGEVGLCVVSLMPEITAQPILPDLTCLVTEEYLKDAYISPEDGKKLLRFSTAAANIGKADLELSATVNNITGITDAFQVVKYTNGTSIRRHIGRFVFAEHADHNHFHFDEFATYELRDLSGNLVAGGDKTTFCLMDVMSIGGTGDDEEGGRFTCEDQGISAGWADVYHAELEGQYVDVTKVPDGRYVLSIVANGAGRIQESDTTNNVGSITVEIKGDEVTVVD